VIRAVEIDFLSVVQLEKPSAGAVVVTVHWTPLPDKDTLDSVANSDYRVTIVKKVVLLFVPNRSLVVVQV